MANSQEPLTFAGQSGILNDCYKNLKSHLNYYTLSHHEYVCQCIMQSAIKGYTFTTNVISALYSTNTVKINIAVFLPLTLYLAIKLSNKTEIKKTPK